MQVELLPKSSVKTFKVRVPRVGIGIQVGPN